MRLTTLGVWAGIDHLAAAQKDLNEQSGNRFLLGLGVSHVPFDADFSAGGSDRLIDAVVARLGLLAPGTGGTSK